MNPLTQQNMGIDFVINNFHRLINIKLSEIYKYVF